MRAHLSRKNYSRNLSSIRSGPVSPVRRVYMQVAATVPQTVYGSDVRYTKFTSQNRYHFLNTDNLNLVSQHN